MSVKNMAQFAVCVRDILLSYLSPLNRRRCTAHTHAHITAVIIHIDTHGSNGNFKIRERHSFKFLKMQIFQTTPFGTHLHCTRTMVALTASTHAHLVDVVLVFYFLLLQKMFHSGIIYILSLHSATFSIIILYRYLCTAVSETPFCITKQPPPRFMVSFKYSNALRSMYLVEQMNDEQ